MQKGENTYEEGTLTFIFYPTNDGKFVAACNELCIIKEGEDAELVKLEILGSAKSYLINVCTNNLGEHLLNQSLPEEIIDEFKEHVKSYLKKKIGDDFEKWSENFDAIKKKDFLATC